MKPSRKSPARAYQIKRDYQDFGLYLAERRIAAGLTQRQVAESLGYTSAQFISNFERGIAVPPMPKLKLLLGMYKMPLEKVLDLILDCERARIAAELNAPGKKRRA